MSCEAWSAPPTKVPGPSSVGNAEGTHFWNRLATGALDRPASNGYDDMSNARSEHSTPEREIKTEISFGLRINSKFLRRKKKKRRKGRFLQIENPVVIRKLY